MAKLHLVLLGFLATAVTSSRAATDIGTLPFNLFIDALCPAIRWGQDFQTTIGGNSQPHKGEFGWGKPAKVVDTTKPSSDATAKGRQFTFNAATSSMTLQGQRDPTPPPGAVVISALVNSSQQPTNVIAPQDFQAGGQLLTVDLPMGENGVTFSASGAPGVYTIYGIEVPLQVVTNYSSISDMPVTTELFVTNGTLNPRFSFQNSTFSDGMWQVRSATSQQEQTPVASTQQPIPSASSSAGGEGASGGGTPSSSSGSADYFVATGQGSGVEVAIGIPDGTTFIIVNGTTGPNAGTVNAKWQPSPLNADSFGLGTVNSSWVAPTILYYRQLNPSARYVLTLSPSLGALSLHSITYYNGLNIPSSDNSNSGGGSKKSSNTGAIVGGTVGGVVGGLALAGLALWLCLWRPRKKKLREEAEAAAYLDNTGYTPFVQEVDGGAIPDENAMTVPPSYNPAWAGESTALQGDAAAPPGMSQLPVMNEKQRMVNATRGGQQPNLSPGGLSHDTPVSPIVADLKRPSFSAMMQPQQNDNPQKKSTLGSSDEKSATTKESHSSGYSEGMMRAHNPDP